MHFLKLLALLPLAVSAAPTNITEREPVIPRVVKGLIANRYIVKLKDDITADNVLAPFPPDRLPSVGLKITHVYNAGGFKGFAIEIDETLLGSLREHPNVEWIEQDAVVDINASVIQRRAPWGLGRISHRRRRNTNYVYDSSAGEGTCAYVIDTGIYTQHRDFGGRATFLANFIDTQNTDGNGHGTHVAGTLGGSTYGVAKKTSLYAVKVLDADGTGSTSSVLAGMDFVTGDARTRRCPNGVVSNMSLGGSYSRALNLAAELMVREGIFLAVAIGNSAEDASQTSPASEPSVCTVGASDKSDAAARFSNYGSVLDIYAPGTDIVSTYIGGPAATNTLSGTSMASPHIAGLGAYFLGLGGPKRPEELCAYIQSIASKDILTGVRPRTKNLLAFNNNPSG
ncbi:hypothetical protein M426DRAFT_256596 [Hypoxylon sp. CI-4A]|nr:hypothetical protein M426DRAFT_256596 [Hypoxylon sp. CI-4A]